MIERCYQGPSDLHLIVELTHRYSTENLHLIDLPYRLSSWALDEPQNTRLWFNPSGTLCAWSVLQSPFWTIDCAYDPAFGHELFGAIMDWAVACADEVQDDPAYGHPIWFVNVFDGQTQRIIELVKRGFADQKDVPHNPWSKVFMVRDIAASHPTQGLPSGFRLRTIDGVSEIAAYTALHQAVFQSKNMTEAWRRRVVAQSAYQSNLNLAIEAPDRSLAAFCVGWFDPVGYGGKACGQIEPLGVSQEYRGLGLAKCLLSECFRQFNELGAANVYVETDNYRNEAYALYQAAGFRVLHEVHVFRKDLR